jgi:hypothetical protein
MKRLSRKSEHLDEMSYILVIFVETGFSRILPESEKLLRFVPAAVAVNV